MRRRPLLLMGALLMGPPAGSTADPGVVRPAAPDAPVADGLHRLVLLVLDEPGGPPLGGAHVIAGLPEGPHVTDATGRLALT